MRHYSFWLGLILFSSQPGSLHAGEARQWFGHDVSRLSGGLYASLEGSVVNDNTLPHAAFAVKDTATLSEPIAPWISAVQSIGQDPAQLPLSNKNQAEPHLVRSLVNPLQLLAVFQDGRLANGGASGCGISLSNDGGFTWQRRLHPNLTRLDGTGVYYRATDPVAGADLAGNFYTNHLVAVNSDFTQSHLVLCRSSDGGVNWTQPVVIAASTFKSNNDNTFPDKNWMVVNDFAGTSTEGRVVCSWTRFRTLETANYKYEDTAIYLSYSDNQGATWSSARELTEPAPEWNPGEPFLTYTGSYQSPLPLYLPDGKLIVPYWKFADDNEDDTIRFALSLDGGGTFVKELPAIVTVSNTFSDPYARSGGFIFSGAVARQAGTVFIAYQATDPSAGFSPRIFVTRSLSQAMTGNSPEWTWSTPVGVDDAVPTKAVFGGTIAVSDDGQHVAVYFYDKRNDPSNSYLCDIYLAESFDGGITWQPNVRMTPTSFDMRKATETGAGFMLGDYFGMVSPTSADPAMVGLWVGTSSTESDPRIARIGAWRGSDYSRWVDANFKLEERAVTGPLGDSDQDGLPNLAEFALLTDALIPNEPAVTLLYEDPYFSIGHVVSYPTPVTFGGFTVRWEGSINGLEWERVMPMREDTVIPSLGRIDRVDRIEYGSSLRFPLLRMVTEHPGIPGVVDAASVILAETPHPLGELYPLGVGNWQWSHWLGFVNLDAFPYVYHPRLGWIYDYGTPSGESFYYDFGLGWCYTSAALFPDLFVFAENHWVRHYPTESQSRLFYDYTSGQFEER